MSQPKDLWEFGTVFAEYRELLDQIGERGGGEHWFALATADERKRVKQLRADLNRRYGRVRVALAQALGEVPLLGNAYVTAGEVPQVALADPSDNPWIEAALDGTTQLIAVAIGHYEAHPAAPAADGPPRGRMVRWLGRFAVTTTQQILVGVLVAVVIGVLAIWLQPFGIKLK